MSSGRPDDDDGLTTQVDPQRSRGDSSDYKKFPNYVPPGARGERRAPDQRTMIADDGYVDAGAADAGPDDDDPGSTVMVQKDYYEGQKTLMATPRGKAANAPSPGAAGSSPGPGPQQDGDPNATVLAARPPPDMALPQSVTELGRPPTEPVAAPAHDAVPPPPKLPSQIRLQARPFPVAPTEEVERSNSTTSLPLRTWILLLITAAAAFIMFFGETIGIDLFSGKRAADRQPADTRKAEVVAGSQKSAARAEPKESKTKDGSAAPALPPDLALPASTDPKQAAELFLAGRKREALAHYVVLAREHPDDATFAAIVKILADQVRCANVGRCR